MPLKKILPTLTLAALLLALPRASAGHPPDLLLLEQEIFLGETLFTGPLEKAMARALDASPQELECWWITPQGPVPLGELAKEKPLQSGDYPLSARCAGEKGDRWVNGLCRVQVVSGTAVISAPAGSLVCLKGTGFTLYKQAEKGTPSCRFQELPYGLYTVSLPGSGESPQELYIGVCRENDTVSTQRSRDAARFEGEAAPAGILGGRWILGQAAGETARKGGEKDEGANAGPGGDYGGSGPALGPELPSGTPENPAGH